ncbi:hypothetical protein [uncultured Lutibacter sp.]|uniref:hypothetical protein n=1 Tax=uncultured Lutibacter sp. TaxID=437739 RepID=UPI002636ACB4|nr:hypothetical protein [uncultured Lutibacter sp.]
MKTNLLKIVILLLFINSNLIDAQEWKNLKLYQKETNNRILLEGCWLKNDRKNKTEVWKQANSYNLSLNNGSQKYKTIREIRDFYKWFDAKRIQQGHEIQWIGIAAIATNQLAKLEMNFHRIFIVRNKEVVQFACEGSKKVFSDAFPKLNEIYFSTHLLKGEEAKNWDKNHGFNEQCKLLQPLYNNLSKKAFNKLERMAKAKGIFCFAIPKKLKFEGDIIDCEARVEYGTKKLLPIYLKSKKTQ